MAENWERRLKSACGMRRESSVPRSGAKGARDRGTLGTSVRLETIMGDSVSHGSFMRPWRVAVKGRALWPAAILDRRRRVGY